MASVQNQFYNDTRLLECIRSKKPAEEKLKILRRHLEQRADVNATDDRGMTPLHLALRRARIPILKLLLKWGADVNAYDVDGNTPLYMAVQYRDIAVVKLLINKGADVNAKRKHGDTILHIAVYSGKLSTVQLLLNSGADVNAKDVSGNTPLHEAASYGRTNIVELLLQEGAHVNAQSNNKNTPLHEALRFGHDLISLLLRSGADVTLKNYVGDNPLSYALLFSLNGHKKIVKLLQNAEKTSKNKLVLKKQSQTSCEVFERRGNDITLKINLKNNYKINYSKTNDNCGMLGQLYETKLLSLVFIRVLNHKHVEHDILLGANVNNIGAMDDICLRCRVKGTQKPLVLFMQAKHKEDFGDKITEKDLWSDSGNFSLKKYFKSYLMIRERFQVGNEDPMFEGDFSDTDCYFTLYTSGNENITKKTRNKVNEILHSLINTKHNTKPFQYSYDETDMNRLIKMVAEIQINTIETTKLVEDFFNRLWFYTSQAKEDDVECRVKGEINKNYNNNKEGTSNYIFKFHSDAIFLRAHDEVHKWWKQTGERSVYLSRSDDFFSLAKQACLDDALLTVFSAMDNLKVNVDLEFNQSILERDISTEMPEIFRTLFSRLFRIIYAKNIIITLDKNLKNKIINLLTTDEKLARKLNDFSENCSHTAISSNAIYKNQNFQHTKRSGTSEGGGVLFRTKMLCLVLLRALNYEQEFLLGTKIGGIKVMNDICLRYRVEDRHEPVILFIQLIHRGDPENRKLTDEALWSDSEDFKLLKYFKSYLMIREQFQVNNKNPMFEGEFHKADCYFILYTSAKETISKKRNDARMNKIVKDLINTEKASEPFQYDYEETDINFLTKAVVMDQIKEIGTVFLQSIMVEKIKSLLSDKLIARYHVAMAREVLQLCDVQSADVDYCLWQFRSEFFNSDLEYLVALKETFAKVLLSKCYGQRTITYEHKTIVETLKVVKNLESLKIKLPRTFGNLDMAFRGSKAKVERRIKAVADKVMYLIKINKDTKIVKISDDDVGPGKTLEQGMIDVNGGIGGAVGNLLVFDTDSSMLKFNLENTALPYYASLLYKELKDDRFKPFNEDLSSYRIHICVNGFLKHSLVVDEYDKKQGIDFFSKFWLSPCQAKADKVELILKDEMNRKYSENQIWCNVSDVISLQSLDVIQKWWLQTSESPYLSRASELFECIELTEMYNLLQTVINYMYIAEIQSIDVKVSRVCKNGMFEYMHQVFKNISGKLFQLVDSQFDNSLDFRPPNDEYETSKLSLRIHPEMEWVSLTMAAEFRNVDYYSLVTKINLRSNCLADDEFVLNEIQSGGIYFTIKSKSALLSSGYHIKRKMNDKHVKVVYDGVLLTN